MSRTLALAQVLVLVAGCGGSTGSALVTFSATASGPPDAVAPLSFVSGLGADVTLTRARLHLGAVYLNQSRPVSGAAAEPCVSPGTYVAEAFGPVDVDLLSPAPQPFPAAGEGTQTEALTAEVWLTGGDVNATDDATVILDVAGTAVQAGATVPFSAAITIGANRAGNITNPALPGANPICHKRIVSPIQVDLTPTDGGTLAVTIDPRSMFNAVDFSSLTEPTIPDTSAGAGGALYKGLFANAGVYSFAWIP